ncbi:LysR family transcriptional regulator [Marinobacterium rhizophilum]|uniref:LysR family transcriptional regulator n=1 Tax=Marinobacterium rhizophilum TaxID=420402 RepID=UPI0003777B87|nr:LysR family transcriptional regulator [Marinobacterium rhizophilum]
MKTHQLKAFLAVHEAGSLQAAALQLHITQPALSKAIKELENQYGVTLFDRNARGITLTAYGERLLGYARLMHETARRARQDLDGMKGMLNSEVTIGITPISSLLKPLVGSFNEFQRRQPGANLRILEMRPAQLLEQLRQGGIDFAVTSQVPVMESALEWQPICRIPNVVVVRKEHPQRHTKSLRVLQQTDWLSLDPPKDQSTYYYQLFAVNGLPLPTHVRECTSMTLARMLMQSADLAALFSREALEYDHLKEEFAIVPLVENIPDSLISMVTPKREIMTRAATELFQIVLEDMRKRYPEFS